MEGDIQTSVTELLAHARAGRAGAWQAAYGAVYEELKRVARGQREAPLEVASLATGARCAHQMDWTALSCCRKASRPAVGARDFIA
jgi:hypothetical protein